MPFGRSDLSASPTGPGGGSMDRSGDSFDLSDIAVVPIQLNWNTGLFSFEDWRAVIAPTGRYEKGRAINLGRFYWSFDTNAAVTWFDPKAGREIPLVPGSMLNTENSATEYDSGADSHMDFTASQFLSPSFAVGLRGYLYQKIRGDSGAGAVLDDFKSEVVGLGVWLRWSLAFASGRRSILGKWMRDVHA